MPLADVDSTKVDGKNLTLVVVEKVKKGEVPARYRLACAKGPLKGLYSRPCITLVPNVTMEVLGLKDIFESWRGKHEISQREAAASTSLVGGQGVTKCGCKVGQCQTKKCTCFSVGVFCSSRCHGGLNQNCCNHPENNAI